MPLPDIGALATIPPPPGADFALGPLTLHAYGLILGLAIVSAVLLTERTFPWVGYTRDDVLAVALPAIVAGVIGSRVYHVLSEPTRYWEQPGDIVAIWNGGLGIYGGVIGGMGVGMWLCLRRGLKPARCADAAVAGIALAQAIGRWGNWVNQELYGGPTDLPWGLRVDGLEGAYHPTFLYESLWSLANMALLLWLLKRWKDRPDGAVTLVYFAVYSLGRVWVEGLRIDATNELLGLRQNQLIAALVAAVAIAGLAWLVRRHGRQAVTE